jgi:3-dehydroquinate synthase
LRIGSGDGDYSVDFVDEIKGVVEQVGQVSKPIFVVDRRLAQIYEKELAPLLRAFPHLLLDATEDEKTLDGVTRCVTWIQSLRSDKKTTLVAIGGGITQDICAFSTHIYYRGIKWVFVPTTLLSMGDSCIGGKCGINLNGFKNHVGVFHPPSRVIICTKFLDSLNEADLASGYGEVLRLMLTGSQRQFDLLRDVLERSHLRTPELADLIYESLNIKKGVIEQDEYELNLRRILNYGHTFGHSLEKITDHAVPHGLAVAWGVDIINYLSVKRGLMAEENFKTVHEFIRTYLPFRLPRPISAHELIQGARGDKKVENGQLTLILSEGPGALKITSTPFDSTLEREVEEYLKDHNVFDCA